MLKNKWSKCTTLQNETLTMDIYALVQSCVSAGHEDAIPKGHHGVPASRKVHRRSFMPRVVPVRNFLDLTLK